MPLETVNNPPGVSSVSCPFLCLASCRFPKRSNRHQAALEISPDKIPLAISSNYSAHIFEAVILDGQSRPISLSLLGLRNLGATAIN